MTTYKDAGVDVELGDEASKILYNAAKITWANRKNKLGEVIELFPDFSGFRAIKVGGLPIGTYMNLSFDGIGTKTEVAERMSKHDTAAYDLFAMVCDDAVVRGGEPVIIGSILDVNSLDGKKKEMRQLARGYIGAARKANVAVVNGEIAELGARVEGYGNFNYNWGAGVVWFANEERILTGEKIKVGDSLVALREDGFRSNGMTLVRAILSRKFGKEWHEVNVNGIPLGDAVLTPSTIYTKAVVDMFGGYDLDKKPKAEIHGVAHITGGGIPGKLGRALKPTGLGARIKPIAPPAIMKLVKRIGGVSDEEAYRTWNMGNGMIIITPEPEKVIEVAKSHEIYARNIGEIIKKPSIIISPKRISKKTIEFKVS